MDEVLRIETERLTRSWERHEADFLQSYLVSSVEDPRRNLQSILTRHFLLNSLFGPRFAGLMEQELLFAGAFGWLADIDRLDEDERAAILHALRQGSDNAEGRVLPGFIVQVFQSLPAVVDGMTVPNYIAEVLTKPSRPPEEGHDTFRRLWAEALALLPDPGPKPAVLEAACGSANDYRFLHAYGLARFLDYRGIDLASKNIANARALFPEVRFEVGNVFRVDAPDQHFDHGFVHDLFEHLSCAGLEQALAELCRVTRQSLCLGFFSMDELPEHIVRPLEDYHWNTLSMGRVKESLARHGFQTQVFHIDTYARWLIPGQGTHNANAYTLVAQRADRGTA